MSKKAVILTADKFEDMEVFFPTFRLMEEGWKVDIAAPKKVELHGENGYQLEPDKTFDEIDPKDYDLLYVPGGAADGAPLEVSKNKKAQEIVKYFFDNNKHVVTICHGPYLLAAADVIKGRHLTSYWYDEVPEKVKAAGGFWKDEEVVVDKNLVSSRWPMDLPIFMREVIKLVKKN